MRSRALLILSWGAALIVPAAVGAMLWHLCAEGAPELGLELFFGDAPPLKAILGQFPVWDGIWPAAAGTLSLLALTMALALLPGGGCSRPRPPRACCCRRSVWRCWCCRR
ncbi:hypothetical protein [Pyramidobacter sp. C12-8]|uniref:hypothetical protein n=1 Tax=Pyramidobacter sp. C12-8 TaxID=1943580 RepID=UPI001F0AD5D8|nr:hypothetical protein [Pyramidobacter sp. C12-8]